MTSDLNGGQRPLQDQQPVVHMQSEEPIRVTQPKDDNSSFNGYSFEEVYESVFGKPDGPENEDFRKVRYRPPPTRMGGVRVNEYERSVSLLLTLTVWLMAPSDRDRYLEEFRAELLDVPHDTRLRHALSLLRGVFVLRLRRGRRSKAADAAARRAKG